MKFFKISSLDHGVDPLRDRLMKELADGREVLWLVPGGSNIPLTIAIMAQIPDDLTHRLTIMLTDERFGPVGHKDSNAHQLDEMGFLPKESTVIPVLGEGMDIDETCQQYALTYKEAAANADIIIGQFGMGPDGHIAGILPRSPAVSSADLAAAYEAPNFTRITLTPKALQQLAAAYVFAFGAEKRQELLRLRDETIDLSAQPAQLLKHLPDASIYNDQIGDV